MSSSNIFFQDWSLFAGIFALLWVFFHFKGYKTSKSLKNSQIIKKNFKDWKRVREFYSAHCWKVISQELEWHFTQKNTCKSWWVRKSKLKQLLSHNKNACIKRGGLLGILFGPYMCSNKLLQKLPYYIACTILEHCIFKTAHLLGLYVKIFTRYSLYKHENFYLHS